MSLKIGVSGVRGIIGESLTEEVISDFAKAFGTFVKRGARGKAQGAMENIKNHAPCTKHQAPSILIGRDTRASGEFVRRAVVDGLFSAGCRITDLGLCPTPTMLFATRYLKACGAIIITASHNPQEWNGLKFVRPDGTFLNKDEIEKLISIYKSKAFSSRSAAGSQRQSVTFSNGVKAHLDAVLGCVHASAIKKAGFNVAVDYCNGTGAVATKYLLERLGCRILEINASPDGNFAHNPEPAAANLGQLCDFVKKTRADVGFAQDPDADRLAVVSEKAVAIGEENTLALAVKHVLISSKAKVPSPRAFCGERVRVRGESKTCPPHLNLLPPKGGEEILGCKVVINLSTSRMIDDICDEFGARLYRSAVGETNVVDKMRQVGALIGGEGNGGVIYPEVNFGRDSFVAMALILEYIAKSGKKVSELAAGIKQYYIEKTKIECPQDKIQEVLEKIKSRGVLLYAPLSVNTQDGVKIDYPDGWVHARGSNTEPVIRIMAEARTPEAAAGYIEKIRKIMDEADS